MDLSSFRQISSSSLPPSFHFQSTLFTCCGQNRLQKYSEVKETLDKSSLSKHLTHFEKGVSLLHIYLNIMKKEAHHSHMFVPKNFNPLKATVLSWLMLTSAFSAFICANSKISFRVKEGKALNTLATQIIYHQAKMIVKITYQLAISCFFMGRYMSKCGDSTETLLIDSHFLKCLC